MEQKQTVLLAEDEEDDVFMMRRAVQKMNDPVLLQIAQDGEQAIGYLSGKNQYADRALFPLPTMILLDIKMPRKNGFEVLAWCNGSNALAHIPILMLSSSKGKSDVDKSRELGAWGYLVKPIAVAELERLLTAKEEFFSVQAARLDDGYVFRKN